MNGVTIITLNRSLYSCLRSCLVNPGVASLCIFTYCTLLSHIYCCTNPVVMFILACLHNCITPTLACLCTSPPASFYHSQWVVPDNPGLVRSDPGADDEGLPPSPGALEWAAEQVERLENSPPYFSGSDPRV
jgi:hypothetical protein